MFRKPKCVIFDMDYTLSHFTGGLGFFRSFISHGLTESETSLAYKKSFSGRGFTIERMIKDVEEITGRALPSQKIREDFHAWLHESLSFYADSQNTLRQIGKRGIGLALITAGDEEYQRLKINTLGIDVNDIQISTPSAGKAKLVKNVLDKHGAPCAIVEDSPVELDRVRDAGISNDELITVRVLREDSPYVSLKARHKHLEIRNLDDLMQLIQQGGPT